MVKTFTDKTYEKTTNTKSYQHAYQLLEPSTVLKLAQLLNALLTPHFSAKLRKAVFAEMAMSLIAALMALRRFVRVAERFAISLCTLALEQLLDALK